MRYSDFIEQIGLSTTGTPPTGVSPTTPSTGGLSGNVQQLQDPKMQAAQLAKQKQEKDKQKKQIQDQIAALQKQLADLNRTV